ncbi:MAG TPA: NADH-quinone oxidoreductase subunit A [Dehalococcoidia bacterium]|nr:NADH-quinone oxidoreductase subunit A [Dehalococcoidia bacterium]
MARRKGQAGMQALFENYVAVLVAAGTGCILVITAIIATRLLAPFSSSREKGIAYECGMLPIGRIRTQIHVRYYVYAILFLIFDVEAVFLFPWAVSVVQIGETALYSMIIFILILGAGLGYAWKKGALEWK